MSQSKHRRRGRCALIIALVLLSACFIISFVIGPYDLTVAETVDALWRGMVRLFTGDDSPFTRAQIVVINIRLPRILGAICVGAALSVAGAVYQGLFKNPMASPDILGASAGAGFGAALAITLSFGYWGITFAAFVTGLAAVGLACLVSARFRLNRTLGLILSGMVISSLFSAGTSYLKLIADTTNTLPAITYWLMGSLSGMKLADLGFLLPAMAVGMLPLFIISTPLNAMTLGDDEARSLGVNVTFVRGVAIAATTLITALSVAFAGVVGWVGLLMPHIARRIAGADYRLMLPTCAALGAAFMLIVDDLARTLTTSELPIGILTAVIGAPFFLIMIMKGERTLSR